MNLIFLLTLIALNNTSVSDNDNETARQLDLPASPEVLLIIGEGPQYDYNSRVRTVRSLTRDLSRTDLHRLIDFLETPPGKDPLKPVELNAIKNDISNALLRQQNPHPNVSASLIKSFHDEKMDAMWRDYCLQHLAHWHRVSENNEERNAILETLWKATEYPESTFAGTALLSLKSVQAHSPSSVDSQLLTERALAVAQNPEMSLPSRISGIQVARDHPDSLDLARSIVQDATVNALLRTSALSVLGNSDHPDDLVLLEKTSRSSDIRLRRSAKAALQRQKADTLVEDGQ